MTRRKVRVIRLLAALIGMVMLPAQAGLLVDRTRYVFEENQQSIMIVVENPEKQTYGGQIWIENINEADTRPVFVVTPPFFKIIGEGKQILKVIKALENMPTNKESIYWVNLQEIPPINQQAGLSIALRTKVKLLYRPKDLVLGRKEAEKDLLLVKNKNKSELVNTTPYIFAITDILDEQDKALILDKKTYQRLAIFSPGESVALPVGSSVKSVMSINDLGQVGRYVLDRKALDVMPGIN